MRAAICCAICHVLANMYTSHIMHIAWNGIYSNYCSIQNGLKQGRVTSPVLFWLYIDGLLKLLPASKIGCYIGDICKRVLIYDDDIFLLAPSLQLCVNYYKFVIVMLMYIILCLMPKKSKCLFFHVKDNAKNTCSPNQLLKWVAEPSYYTTKKARITTGAITVLLML